MEEELERVTVKQKKNELESDEFQKVIELNKNYKKEIKSVTAKVEKVNHEYNDMKYDKDALDKEVTRLSVALKASIQDAKENVNKHEEIRKDFDKQINNLQEYKINYEKEARESRRIERKRVKNAKQKAKKAAEAESKKLRDERVEALKEHVEETIEDIHNDSLTDDENNFPTSFRKASPPTGTSVPKSPSLINSDTSAAAQITPHSVVTQVLGAGGMERSKFQKTPKCSI